MIQHRRNKPTTIRFDVIDEESPNAIAMYVNLHSVTANLSSPTVLIIKRPPDDAPMIHITYTSEESTFDARLWLSVASIFPNTSGLLGKKSRSCH